MIPVAAPDGVGNAEPEGRSPGAGGKVDVNVGLLGTKFVDQGDDSFKVGAELRAFGRLSFAGGAAASE